MNNQFELENKYLTAKLAYYNGNPIMSDSSFDSLEKLLKENNSKVVNQVGAKTKDFNFSHPTNMLSLSKIQTEKYDDGSTNYMFDDFISWYKKRTKIVGLLKLYSSPKFDGNAINVIYIGGKLTSIITRGDGEKGKDVTTTLKSLFPDTLLVEGISIDVEDIIEIRCEIVINKYLFDDKYSSEFANPRNYVAGVIGKDDSDKVKVSELEPLPLHFKLNGEHVSSDLFMSNEFVSTSRYEIEVDPMNFIDVIKNYEKMRSEFKYQLDGVVFSFSTSVRLELGENSHDPEWAIAIKFIPDEAITSVIGIEWNISKTGELTPVLLLTPVELGGTIVKRVSGYNYGYVLYKKLGYMSDIKVIKSGEIIPEVLEVVIPSDDFSGIPTVCPSCGTTLVIDDIHLLCPNESCGGKIAKQLARNCKLIELKGIGPKTIEYFSDDFNDLIDVICWVRTKGNSDEIEKYGINFNSRSHDNFLSIFNNIKSLTYGQVIVMLGYDNVGLKLAEQIANMYFEIEPDFTSQTKVLVDMLSTSETKQLVFEKVLQLESCGIKIEVPSVKVISSDTIFVCMTGSPKVFGFATKNDFVKECGIELIDVSISSKECKYLITDDYNSTSSKMKTANKKGIEIFTYGDFIKKLS